MSDENPEVPTTEDSQPTGDEPTAPPTKETPAEETKPDTEPAANNDGIDLSSMSKELSEVEAADPAAAKDVEAVQKDVDEVPGGQAAEAAVAEDLSKHLGGEL